MLIPRHRITISVKFISHFSGKTTHCHSEELKLVFVNSCQGILGGKMLFVFHGASVRIHSCLTSIVLKKRNRKPFEKRLDYGDRAARLSGTAAWVQEGSVSTPPADCSPICLTSLYHKLVIIPPRHHDMKIVSVVVCRHDEIEAGHHWWWNAKEKVNVKPHKCELISYCLSEDLLVNLSKPT